MPKTTKEKSLKKKSISTEDLALMIGKGFAATATKADLGALRAELAEDINKLDVRVTGLDRKLDAHHQDIMRELQPLTKLAPNLEADIIEHEQRIKVLEQHAGIRKE